MWVAEIKRLKYYNTKILTAFNGNKLYLFLENHRTLIFSLTLELQHPYIVTLASNFVSQNLFVT